jgi:rubrerythrin
MKTRKVSRRGRSGGSRTARSPDSVVDGAPDSAANGEEDAEFLARAWNMEVEAVERYSILADAMEEHNNPAVAELFRKLARIEQLHADNILDQTRSLRQRQAIAAGRFRWDENELPETADPGELHYRMQPYHALQMALLGEQRANEFFARVARTARSDSVRKAALEMAAEETEHVRLIEDWISRTPVPDDDWAYDPDPPASCD